MDCGSNWAAWQRMALRMQLTPPEFFPRRLPPQTHTWCSATAPWADPQSA